MGEIGQILPVCCTLPPTPSIHLHLNSEKPALKTSGEFGGNARGLADEDVRK